MHSLEWLLLTLLGVALAWFVADTVIAPMVGDQIAAFTSALTVEVAR